MYNKIYSIGDFAELCGTTKATLMTYEKKGLLKPVRIEENGYRYYSSSQSFTFRMIKAFQMTGASLSEIEEQLRNRDPNVLFEVLEKKRTELAKKQFEIMQMQQFVEHLLSEAKGIFYDDGDIHIRYFPEEYGITISTGYKKPPETGYFYACEKFIELSDYIKKKGYHSSLNFGSSDIISREFFEKGEFYPTYYTYFVPFKPDDPYLHIKPAGMYAVMYSHCPWDKIPKNCKKFKELLEQKGYKTSGDLYNSDISFSLLIGEEEISTTMFSIKIEK